MKLDFDKQDGLVPAIVQDASTREVLMLGYVNAETLEETIQTGIVTFFSRSRQKRWQKGETSGHQLIVKAIRVDCDRDSVLIAVDPIGPGVCHEGYRSCFAWELRAGEWCEVEAKVFDPKQVYASC